MTTSNLKTKISKEFTMSSYEKGSHRTTGWLDIEQRASFAESWSPLELMVDSFRYRPLGTKIKVTMEEVD
jgi:hypothetical protein